MHRRQLLRTLSGAALAAPFAGSALLATPGVAVASGRSARRDQLQALFDAEHAAGMPGAFVEIRDSQHTFELATGVADITTNRPAHPWMSHRIGGASKTFVGVLVLMLVAKGKIDLDKPIGHYLPTVVPGERGQQITVRMLLNQTSGIAEYMNLLFATSAGIEQNATHTYRPIDLVRLGLNEPQIAPPGVAWSYAHTNYVILGMLVEKVTRNRYEDELSRRVLRPLGLWRTYSPGHERRIRGPHLGSYVPWTNNTLRDFGVYDMTWAWAGCDMVSTAQDMNRFFRCLLGGKVLPPSLLAEMMTTVPFNPIFKDFAGYGLGIYWVLGSCGKTWGHNGLVVGQSVYSAHSEDGHSMQYTLAESYNFFEPISSTGAPSNHPISLARQALLSSVTSVCLPPAAGLSKAAAPSTLSLAPNGWTPPIPDVNLVLPV